MKAKNCIQWRICMKVATYVCREKMIFGMYNVCELSAPVCHLSLEKNEINAGLDLK